MAHWRAEPMPPNCEIVAAEEHLACLAAREDRRWGSLVREWTALTQQSNEAGCMGHGVVPPLMPRLG